MPEVILPQRYSKTADISQFEALNRDQEINFLSPGAQKLPQFRRY
jgi:hypothetical protein